MTKSKVKRFRIGERAIGGIIEARVTDEGGQYELVEVKALDWSNPANVVLSDWAETDHVKWYNSISNTLNEMTSSYYADKVLEWITGEVKKYQSNKKQTI